jgi:hypothetical protein
VTDKRERDTARNGIILNQKKRRKLEAHLWHHEWYIHHNHHNLNQSSVATKPDANVVYGTAETTATKTTAATQPQ